LTGLTEQKWSLLLLFFVDNPKGFIAGESLRNVGIRN
jgi:hypothetical protein